jgi:PAS domain S-box-containing protein
MASPSSLHGKNNWRNAAYYLIPLSLLIVIGWLSFLFVKDEIKHSVSNSLHSAMEANFHSLNLWIKEKKLDAEVLVMLPQFREKILAHINYSSKAAGSPEILKNSPDLIWLQKHLGATCKKYDFVGFVLFDKTGLQVGALLDGAIGKKMLIKRSNFFQRSLKGETVISHPFPSEIPLPDSNGKWHDNFPTMFLSVPVENDQEEIMGVVAFRIRPESDFSNLLKVGRFGESGETYLFNQEGIMLSDSRFNDHLRKAGLISPSPDSRALLNIRVLNPIVNLTESPLPEAPSGSKELTLMAKSATSGKWGIDLQGYNDYRGVPVVGIWKWIPEFSLGITTEINKAEAYQPLEALIKWVSVLFGFLVVSTVLMFILRQRNSHFEQQHSSALQSIKEIDERMRSLVSHLADGIITIDQFGSIESINPAGEKIFGFSSQELVGESINILIPESQRNKMTAYLQNIFKLQDKNPSGVYRELVGRRKDGSSIYLEWGFSFMQSEKGPLITGITRDISERRQFQLELERSNQALQDFASIASHDLKEPLRKIISFGDRLKSMLPDLEGCKARPKA